MNAKRGTKMQKNNPEVQFVFNPCKDRLKTEKIIKIFYTALKRHSKEAQNGSTDEQKSSEKAVGRSS